MNRFTDQARRIVHLFRQLGPRIAVQTLVLRGGSWMRGPLRRLELRYRPLHVSAEEVARAHGHRAGKDLLLNASRALPSVARRCQRFDRQSPCDRREILDRAEEICLHRFDLLGSSPTDLGSEIDWQRDFKSGRSWPLDHISKIRVSYPDGSDVKVPWELSRGQHLPLLAAAHRIDGDARYLNELGMQLSRCIAANPVEFGANWACTMDVAIRAVNWLAALVVAGDDATMQPWFDEVIASLLLHARFIRTHLEYGPARGNHYLSDVVGLLCVASLFIGSTEGRDWASWAARELGREMAHEVRADGCCHEASISYHRLVTELFVVGADAADALVPGELDPSVRTGVVRMLQFVSDYTKSDGLAPQIGDADNGRLLPLGDYGAVDQRCHLHLFEQAGTPRPPVRPSAAYAQGGFYIMRAGDLYAAVRCGDVGIYGRGCHAHNDLLAFELNFGSCPVVVDPGTYLYTADPAARNAFRSTAVHSTLQIDGAEQNEIREDRLFAMVDRARPEVLAWEADERSALLTGRHVGYRALPVPATHTRTIRLISDPACVEITDRVESAAAHDLSWTFPLDAERLELMSNGHAVASFANLSVSIEADGLHATLVSGCVSFGYGECHQLPVLRLSTRSHPGEQEFRILLSVTSPPDVLEPDRDTVAIGRALAEKEI